MNRIRFKPAAVILALATAGLAYGYLANERNTQNRIMAALAIGILTALALVAWLLFFSGLSRAARSKAAGLLALGAGACFGLVRVRGVTGDFLPILEPRWVPKERLATAPVGEAPPTAAADSRSSAPVPASSPVSAVADKADTPVTREPAKPAAPAAEPAPEARAGTLNDYPQFLGPNRDGTLHGAELARDWNTRPPRLLWRQPIGLGWSAFAVAGRSAVTQEQRGPEELVTCYELLTGRLLWSHADRVRFDSVIAGDGPRATPTIEAGRVYTMGSTGVLNALELSSGRRLWSHDVVKQQGASVPDFGKVSAPLVVGGLVIVSAGGGEGRSLLAYHAQDGTLAWSAGDDLSGYGSPALVTLLGQPQVLIFNRKSVAAHDPETGRVLWQHAWPATQPNVAQPLPLGPDRVLFSAGYGLGSKLFAVSRAGAAYEAKMLWETPRLKSKFVNMLSLDGLVYGLDDGVLACLDPATGERRWRAGRYGHGQMILVERTLLVQTEEGELLLVDPNPDGLSELARFQALAGKTWNPPALALPYLLVRNDKEAALFELPLEGR